MEQAIRNKLRNVVTQCRKLLEESVRLELQGRFGIYAAKKNDIHVDDDAHMTHLDAEEMAARKDILDHLSHITARGFNPKDGLDQLVREIAFTHLNRFCAYKMMEARKVHVGGRKFREAVSRGLKSQGFLFYLADHPEYEQLYKSGKQDVAYRKFLDWLGETLSEEIGVLFNPSDPANRIYPPQRVLDEVLALINTEELIDIWTADETIGWVYQYFTPKELRDKARKESQAPRNSYELAFRNQFFTPRYVVEFLTDNTLGRIWYEMRKGDTSLLERCRYLVRRPTEIFLKEGEAPPAASNDAREDLSQEELLKQPVHIPHRPKKDPREIKVLDPACGSGHFLLYCFDLLQVIYEEAYNDAEFSDALRQGYPNPDDFRREVPRLILEHNLHGIDIDLRATQIAALALWLRCQRAYQELDLRNGKRPKITRSNIVCAEPMPGETDLLKEFTATLQPKVLAQLVESVFEKMKLAGEAGSLLKIEEEIRYVAVTAKKEYQHELRWQKEQDGYLPGMAPPRGRTLFDFSDMTDSEFLDRAEEEIVATLLQYTDKALNGSGFRRRLFAADATMGFAFVDLCRKRYDVVLMNPPFGLGSENIKNILEPDGYRNAVSKNLAWGFVERAKLLLTNNETAFLGAIVDRTIFQKSSYELFRTTIIQDTWITEYLDLGYGVLDDADVRVAAFCCKTRASVNPTTFLDERQVPVETKEAAALEHVGSIARAVLNVGVHYRSACDFLDVPFASFGYWLSREATYSLFKQHTIADLGFRVGGGLQCNDVFRFVRLWPEVPVSATANETWVPFYNGGPFTGFWIQNYQYVLWSLGGQDIKSKIIHEMGDHPSRYVANEQMYFLHGIAGGKRGEYFDVHVLPSGMIFSNEGRAFQADSRVDLGLLLAYLNHPIPQNLVNAFCGQHKGADYLRRIPIPHALVERKVDLTKLAETLANIKRLWSTIDEFGLDFVMPTGLFAMPNGKSLKRLQETLLHQASLSNEQYCMEERTLDEVIRSAFGHGLADELLDMGWTESPRPKDCVELAIPHLHDVTIKGSLCSSFVSYAVGTVFGRWDVRISLGDVQPPELPGPFDPISVCPPGMLQGQEGLPANPADVPSDYPIRINWEGILIDNPEHEDDIVRRVRNVLEVIWKDSSEAIEKEACEILGVRELRDYFRKPGNGGFWMDHVKRYSKSRRKAPIYWYLRSAKGNYGLWLYYHRLDKDILFKALLNYVEPKVRLEEERLKEFRVRKQAAGSAGREAKQIEKDMDRQEQFVSELQDFSDKLRRAADLHLDPDLNDGVVLNIAALWELVPWKEAKNYWEELLEGKYEWSSIGKQLREKGLV